MFYHKKQLQYFTPPQKPDAVYAMKIQELIGGTFGEMTVMMQYLFQGWNCRGPAKYRDMLLDVGTEEIGHIEMLATMIAHLLDKAPIKMQEESAKDAVVGAVMGGSSITSKFWPRQDNAFVNIVEKIMEEVEKIQEEQRQLQLIRDQQKSEFFASINRLISYHFLNRIIRGTNVPTFSVGIATSVIVIAVLLRFCNSFPETQVTNLENLGQNKLEIPAENIDYIKRANDHYSLKNYQAAIKDYTQAIQIAPKNVNAYIKRGHAQYYIKKYQIAIDDYTTAIRLSPDSADTYENRGFVYEKNLRNKQKAIKDYQKAATLYKKQGAKNDLKKMLDRLQRLQQKKPRFSN